MFMRQGGVGGEENGVHRRPPSHHLTRSKGIPSPGGEAEGRYLLPSRMCTGRISKEKENEKVTSTQTERNGLKSRTKRPKRGEESRLEQPTFPIRKKAQRRDRRVHPGGKKSDKKMKKDSRKGRGEETVPSS